jgi:hypothetical protein
MIGASVLLVVGKDTVGQGFSFVEAGNLSDRIGAVAVVDIGGDEDLPCIVAFGA